MSRFNRPLVVSVACWLILAICLTVAFATTIYDLRVTRSTYISAPLRALVMSMSMYTNASTWTLTSADYGKTFNCPGKAAQAIALPAAGAAAGSWMRFIGTGDNSYAPTFATPISDNLIAPNNATADSVTYGTGHRIGFALILMSNGTYWCALNENAGCTMTVTDT
jgi:hypothetical protein